MRRGGTVKQIRALIARYMTRDELVKHLLTTLIYLDKDPLDVAFHGILLKLKRAPNKTVSNLATLFLEDNQDNAVSDPKVSEQ